ncbi:protein LTO1 homolog [Hydractinia symbiolongicarpus]|uniref:protein LTO1 homolog n=1 Tax=Hydractinia symbiolongicarpus TaxID=13093 RepID=UPI00255164C8|nr:protein LTO1 homolog [Hydractinia symbiolongicarpus]
MAFNDVKLDPDDPFDKIVFMEEGLQQEGYNAGFVSGKIDGKQQGLKLGISQGNVIGREIGFYKGFVETWLLLLDNNMKKNHQKVLEQLKELVDKFTYDDPENNDTHDLLAQIRTKFRQLSSVLKIPTELNVEHISF